VPVFREKRGGGKKRFSFLQEKKSDWSYGRKGFLLSQGDELSMQGKDAAHYRARHLFSSEDFWKKERRKYSKSKFIRNEGGGKAPLMKKEKAAAGKNRIRCFGGKKKKGMANNISKKKRISH